ncbi:Hsp20 family protein [Marinobacterium rhizophilum]|uniref:Hsp20 family protein n=1 Tax=Marinobacterium rhizophilum TaxID=420402 RepID=A0ABY5HEP5_9GAMM|nr:Hsp20 family protein [Marinobacterium rhizophilum]UTW10439.1 Hsp20 family protein [Marinobacterium rhizophilum]
MNTIDFTPLYRSSIGFDRLAALLDSSLRADQTASGYPPYNIEVIDDDRYAISLAVAGFSKKELELKVENSVLSVSGKRADTDTDSRYLYQGIATRSFERRFNLADHVEVTGAELNNGLLTIGLQRQLPEAMKPRVISINTSAPVLEHDSSKGNAA